MFDAGYTVDFWMCRNRIKVAFPGLDLSGFSPKGNTKSPTFRSKSWGVEICELGSNGVEIHEEVLTKLQKSGVVVTSCNNFFCHPFSMVMFL